MPLHNRQNATMSGVCLEEITATFSSHPLQRVVEQDLIKAIIEIKERISKQLSKLLKFVERDTDFMIGIRYLRYYSQKIFQQATGLTIYESKFKNRWYKQDSWRPQHLFTEKSFYGSVHIKSAYIASKHIYRNNTAYSKWDIKQTQTSPL